MYFHLAPQGSKRVQPGFPRQQPLGQDSDHRLRSRHGQPDLPQLLRLQGEGDTGNWTLEHCAYLSYWHPLCLPLTCPTPTPTPT